MEQIIGRILTDAEFRNAFEKGKDQALKEYAHTLTDEERATLRALTYDSLKVFVQRLVEPMRRERMDRSDYIVGILGILFGVVALGVLGYIYLQRHGGMGENFTLWSKGDARWLELLFWSAFTTLSRGVLGMGIVMGFEQQFQKRQVFTFLVSVFQNAVMALAAVMVVLNFGVSFGAVTLSLKDASMEIVIGLTIISTIFAQQTGDLLASVADWLARVVKSKLAAEEEGREALRMVRSVGAFVQNLNAGNFHAPERVDELRARLDRKLEEVERLIVDGKYRAAMDKLTDDIRTRTDGDSGGDPQDDWIVKREARLELCRRIDDLIHELQKMVGR
jgi:hypothetical protein